MRNKKINLPSLSQKLQACQTINDYQSLLHHCQQTLKSAYLEGTSAIKLLQLHTNMIDIILIHVWQQFHLPESNICLIAVGGYGARELYPYSDIDLFILIGIQFSHYAELEKFLLFLWDIGLEVGQFVCDAETCVNQITQDITLYTNILNLRWLAGDADFFQTFAKKIKPPTLMSHHDFFSAKLQEQEIRDQKYNQAAYQLEPNIKNGPGGLRDIHLINWFAKHYYGTQDLELLIQYGFINEVESAKLLQANATLAQIRFGLHLLTNKKEDRLLFDYQIELAKQVIAIDNRNLSHKTIGDSNASLNKLVEAFMQKYFCVVKEVRGLNILLSQFLFEKTEKKIQEKYLCINEFFQIINHRIGFKDSLILFDHPECLFQIFLVLVQHPNIIGIQSQSLRIIYQYCQQDNMLWNQKHRQIFMEILKQPGDVSVVLMLMNRHSILGKYIPEFGEVIGQMQYDLFHAYTVDQHLLFVVRNIYRFKQVESEIKFPLCFTLINQIQKIDILYLAALFHDIGKGKQDDHSKIGKEVSERFCLQHSLIPENASLVSWLVEHHLLMSMTAQRKDIQDPKIIVEFSEIVNDIEKLNYLYLLTVADICATNENLWNTWKDSLLKNLYFATKKYLDSQKSKINPNQIILQKQQRVIDVLTKKNIAKEAIVTLWQSYGEHYFFLEDEDTLIWHTAGILNHHESYIPLVLIRTESNKGCTEIFIYMKDKINLFATSTAVLDKFHLNVVEANILTTNNGYTIDTYRVLDSNNLPIHDHYFLEKIQNELIKYHKDQAPEIKLKQRRVARHLKYFTKDTHVTFTENSSKNLTQLNLMTTDYQGLLARVGFAFQQCDIRLKQAKIITLGDQVEDLFYITDQYGNMLTEAEKEKLRKVLLEQIQYF